MKIVLIIILVFVIMLIARALSEQYKDKFDFYNNLHLFLCEFKINLSFKQEKIVEFLNKIKPKKHFKIFIDSYKEFLKTNELDLSNLTLLETDEITYLESLIKNIGRNNVETEIGQLNMFIENISIKKNAAEQDKNKLCPVIIKLSLLFAIGLSILLI